MGIDTHNISLCFSIFLLIVEMYPIFMPIQFLLNKINNL